MSKVRLIQFAAVVALLALAAPAVALPKPCLVVCTCETPCIARCSVGGAVTTCGALLWCTGECLAAGAAGKKDDALLSAIYAQPEGGSALATPTQAGVGAVGVESR